MPEYYRTFGEPGEPQVSTHLVHPGMDNALCGIDLAGDEMIHHKPPENLGSTRRRVTCATCLRIVGTVAEHLKIKAKIED